MPLNEPVVTASGLPPLDSILQDLRYAFRALRRDAGFATFAILVVGLGVGASSTVFRTAKNAYWAARARLL